MDAEHHIRKKTLSWLLQVLTFTVSQVNGIILLSHKFKFPTIVKLTKAIYRHCFDKMQFMLEASL